MDVTLELLSVLSLERQYLPVLVTRENGCIPYTWWGTGRHINFPRPISRRSQFARAIIQDDIFVINIVGSRVGVWRYLDGDYRG